MCQDFVSFHRVHCPECNGTRVGCGMFDIIMISAEEL